MRGGVVPPNKAGRQGAEDAEAALTTTTRYKLMVKAKRNPARSYDELEALAARLIARASITCDANLGQDLRLAADAIARIVNAGEVAR
jgi:hypothetical protein